MSVKFLIATLMLFFSRVIPDSTIENPGCIKNTKAAQIMTHKLSASVIIVRSITNLHIQGRLAADPPHAV